MGVPLSLAEHRIVLAAAILLPACALGLRISGWRRACRWSESVRVRPEAQPLEPERVGALVAAVARRLPGKPGCLARSLVVQRLLALQGTPGALRIGVQRVGETLRAHAWVEREGRPVNDRTDVAKHYQAFAGAITLDRFSR